MMSFGDSKAIISNQDGMNEHLEEVVSKHLNHEFKKPFQEHTLSAFKQMDALVKAHQGEIILDSCCGVGQSTRLLAQQNPDALVIGVDKSANRIERNTDMGQELDQNLSNCYLIRADLNDFYRLVVQANWPVTRHYILYPNPWPKAKHLQRRWHGSAVFPYIIKVGQFLELRSNWKIYLEEFQVALKLAGQTSELAPLAFGEQAMTPFEAKYQASGQQCWQLTAKLKKIEQ
jgi:tRNA G46 methylase TrmB